MKQTDWLHWKKSGAGINFVFNFLVNFTKKWQRNGKKNYELTWNFEVEKDFIKSFL